MDSRQEEIYKGLKSIGNEIAAFYKDAINILDSDFESKSYLLAHLSREIDGGFRDVFYVNNEDAPETCPACQQVITSEKCKGCGQSIKPKNSHRDTILSILGVEKESELSKKWHQTAKKFPKYAHRHGAFKDPRDVKEINKLWLIYEDVLYDLIGNYYNIEDRLTQVLKDDKPSIAIINALPNLLKQPSRNIYFFRHLKSMDWLSPLFEKGFFSGDKNPSPVESEDNPGYFQLPQWVALNYLERISAINKQEPNTGTTKLLVQIIDGIINHVEINGDRIDNPYTDLSVLKVISNLPIENISDDYFDFYFIALQTKWDNTLLAVDISELMFKRFIQEKDKERILKLLNLITDYKDNKTSFNRFESLIGDNWLKMVLDQFKKDIINICGINVIEPVLIFIEKMIAIDDFSFNALDIKSIEDEIGDYNIDDYQKQLTYLLRDTLIQLEPSFIKKVVTEFINRKEFILQRLALHTINYHYKELKDIFWNWKDNPIYEADNYKPELFGLFHKHAVELSVEEIKTIIIWIESTEYWLHNYEGQSLSKEMKETIIAIRRKEWYMALLDSKKDIIQERFDYYDKINNSKIESPGQDNLIKTMWGDSSPLSPEDICAMELGELIKYFKEFKEGKHEFMDPTNTGLSRATIEVIKKSPEKFISDLDSLVDANRFFQKTWLSGLTEAWEAGSNFSTIEVFETINRILDSLDFWSLNNASKSSNEENRFVYDTARFIAKGCENDKNAFNEKELEIVKIVLSKIVKYDQHKDSVFKGLSNQSLNTSKGYSYIALILYSLKLARIQEAKEKESLERWDTDIVSTVNLKLEDPDTSILLYYTLGRFLHNLFFISSEWTEKSFVKIFNENNPDKFNAALIGYLLHNPSANKRIFTLLQSIPSFPEKLPTDFSDEGINLRGIFVNHILAAYSHKWISIDDQLIETLINKYLDVYYANIINFYWSRNNKLQNEVIPQIKPLWNKILNVVTQDVSNKTYVKVISGLSKWVNWMDEIDDDVFDCLVLSMKYINSRDRSSFLDIAHKFCTREPEKIADLLLIMFGVKVEYILARDKLIFIVEEIYKNGLKNKANEICVLFGESGFEYLKSTYKKHNT